MLTIEDVETFHRVFGHPIKDSKEYLKHFDKNYTAPQHEDDEYPLPEHSEDANIRLRALRTKLITEECDELQEACNSEDPIEYADALFDILYITLGAIVALGVPRSIGDEVQRSNMSKGVPCSHCAGQYIKADKKHPAYNYDTHPCLGCNNTGVQAIKREDGKILKGPNYSPVDIASIIEKECRDWDKEADHGTV